MNQTNCVVRIQCGLCVVGYGTLFILSIGFNVWHLYQHSVGNHLYWFWNL